MTTTEYTINERTYTVDSRGAVFFAGKQVVYGATDFDILNDLFEILSEREVQRVAARGDRHARAATDAEVAEDISDFYPPEPAPVDAVDLTDYLAWANDNSQRMREADAPPFGTSDLYWHGFHVKGVDAGTRAAEVWHEMTPQASVRLSMFTDSGIDADCAYERLMGMAYEEWERQNFGGSVGKQDTPTDEDGRLLVGPGAPFPVAGVYEIQGHPDQRVYVRGKNTSFAHAETWVLVTAVPDAE